MRSNLLISVFLAVSACLPVYAVDNLRLPDMRSLGMGGNGVTQSVLFNPSLVALYEKKTVHTEYFNRYTMKELGTVRAGFYYPNSILSGGVDISSFGYDQYRESMFRLALGKRVGEKWTVGISMQFLLLQTVLTDEQPKRLSTDLGVSFSPVDKLLVGLLIVNCPSVSLKSEETEIKDFTSYSIQVGFQWEVINSLLIVGTLASTKEHTLTGSGGIEYRPFTDFRIRAGIQSTPLLPTLGIGYSFPWITTDVAVIYHPVLGMSMGIGLAYTF